MKNVYSRCRFSPSLRGMCHQGRHRECSFPCLGTRLLFRGLVPFVSVPKKIFRLSFVTFKRGIVCADLNSFVVVSMTVGPQTLFNYKWETLDSRDPIRQPGLTQNFLVCKTKSLLRHHLGLRQSLQGLCTYIRAIWKTGKIGGNEWKFTRNKCCSGDLKYLGDLTHPSSYFSSSRLVG